MVRTHSTHAETPKRRRQDRRTPSRLRVPLELSFAFALLYLSQELLATLTPTAYQVYTRYVLTHGHSQAPQNSNCIRTEPTSFETNYLELVWDCKQYKRHKAPLLPLEALIDESSAPWPGQPRAAGKLLAPAATTIAPALFTPGHPLRRPAAAAPNMAPPFPETEREGRHHEKQQEQNSLVACQAHTPCRLLKRW